MFDNITRLCSFRSIDRIRSLYKLSIIISEITLTERPKVSFLIYALFPYLTSGASQLNGAVVSELSAAELLEHRLLLLFDNAVGVDRFLVAGIRNVCVIFSHHVDAQPTVMVCAPANCPLRPNSATASNSLSAQVGKCSKSKQSCVCMH